MTRREIAAPLTIEEIKKYKRELSDFSRFNQRIDVSNSRTVFKRWKKNPSAKKNLEKTIPLNRVGKPADISNTVMFLLSDQSNYITGTEFIVDGGITAKP